ncbi:hypothetical protein AB0O68_36480 [Streptomyces sp. NPDC087512]|uniref:hypothetical protein n=1 Tax=Streptomyces sp. NPDC087512 TaxID=3155059 RepID=UPI00342214CF
MTKDADGADGPQTLTGHTPSLSGHRRLGGLRPVVERRSKATVLREGLAQASGVGAAWLAFLCPVHTVDMDGWPGVADHPDTSTMPCGIVLDYRAPEGRLAESKELASPAVRAVTGATTAPLWSGCACCVRCERWACGWPSPRRRHRGMSRSARR